jgi:hypothetical protein
VTRDHVEELERLQVVDAPSADILDQLATIPDEPGVV